MAESWIARDAPRRATDGGRWHTWLRSLITRPDKQFDPVAGGRLLVLASGLVMLATTPLIDPPASSWRVLGLVEVGMAGFLAASYLVPWRRLPRPATVIFPMAVWLALASLGLFADGLGLNFTGLITLCIGYVGLTQTTGTSLKAVVPAVMSYLAAYDGWSRLLFGRLPIATAIWVIIAVVLAELMQRQAVLSEKLYIAAHTDELTGVANRRDLDRRLISARPGDSLVMCDLDNFKAINDARGHAVGDEVLSQFGAVLLDCLRADDYVARYGGEEFAMVLPATDLAQSKAILQRLRSEWSSVQPEITFSAGIARCRSGRAPRETLGAADRALYSAKLAGRDRDQDELSTDTTTDNDADAATDAAATSLRPPPLPSPALDRV